MRFRQVEPQLILDCALGSWAEVVTFDVPKAWKWPPGLCLAARPLARRDDGSAPERYVTFIGCYSPSLHRRACIHALAAVLADVRDDLAEMGKNVQVAAMWAPGRGGRDFCGLLYSLSVPSRWNVSRIE